MSTKSVGVELRSVSKRFGDVVAVDNVSLQVQDGEFFSLLGPSGCGKTTTLRLVAGFEIPTQGDIYLHGDPVGYLPPFKRNVNTVFQNYALFPHLTVAQNVGFGLEMKKLPKDEIDKRVQEALEMVRLPNVGQRKPRQLSGGQQQRIALARAIVNRPQLLLLDEPLGALDLKLRRAMQIELKALQRQLGITFIFVTHDQEEALSMSDRIAVMDQGKALQVGSPQEIYEQPINHFVADFIGETNFLPCKVTARQNGLATVVVDEQVETKAVCEVDVATGQEAILTIRPEKIMLYTSQQATPQQGTLLSAVVDEIVYMGTDTYFTVVLFDKRQIKVRHQNMATTDPLRDLQRGQHVDVSWPFSAARVLAS